METPDVSLRYCISCGVFYPVLNPPSDSNLVVVLCALLHYSLIISEKCWLPLLLSIKRIWIKRYTMGRKHVGKLTYSIWRGWRLFCKLQSKHFSKVFFSHCELSCKMTLKGNNRANQNQTQQEKEHRNTHQPNKYTTYQPKPFLWLFFSLWTSRLDHSLLAVFARLKKHNKNKQTNRSPVTSCCQKRRV